jgi:hypothetical protein
MTTIHLQETETHRPGRPTPRCAAVLSHGQIQIAWDPSSGKHRLGFSQPPRNPAKVTAMA